mmetsp:Transcript_2558/g.6722  ORF Transcript_2558/g.6722 Transcript_2558/m.6722 type:complete len:230 (+) Transcript_2558:305-994(+)
MIVAGSGLSCGARRCSLNAVGRRRPHRELRVGHTTLRLVGPGEDVQGADQGGLWGRARPHELRDRPRDLSTALIQDGALRRDRGEDLAVEGRALLERGARRVDRDGVQHGEHEQLGVRRLLQSAGNQRRLRLPQLAQDDAQALVERLVRRGLCNQQREVARHDRHQLRAARCLRHLRGEEAHLQLKLVHSRVQLGPLAQQLLGVGGRVVRGKPPHQRRAVRRVRHERRD